MYEIINYISTSHKLARELLSKSDFFILATDGNKKFIIENIERVSTQANADDSVMRLVLNLRECGNGNIKRWNICFVEINEEAWDILVVNLFGTPSSGKSTGAAYIFSQLKMRGINAELVTEFAKDKVWENNTEVFKNQAYIFGKQSYRMSRCKNKVDIIITDSPLPLSIFYNKDKSLTENFNKSVMDVFNSYNNLNYFLVRTKPYNPSGRLQTEEESNALELPMKRLLRKRNIPYLKRRGDVEGYQKIIDDVMRCWKYWGGMSFFDSTKKRRA